MYKAIETPPFLTGGADEKAVQLRDYLFKLVEDLNRNLESIGGSDLTDRERAAMQGVVQTNAGNLNSIQSLRDMLVQTVEYFKQQLNQIEKVPLLAEVNNGHFATYVKAVQIGTASDLGGHQVTQSIVGILQALKLDDLKMRNYVYAGKLRTVGGTDIFGVAIGKNVTTYAEDGTETFNPGNVVLEIVDEKIRIMDGGDEILIISTTTGGGDTHVDIKPGLDADYAKFKGVFDGTFPSQTTAESSFDDIEDPASYWINVASVSDGPSDLSSGTYLLEVLVTSGTIHQRISTGTVIYTREKRSGTWAGWYKFEGTAV